MKVQKESRLFYSPTIGEAIGTYELGQDESHHLTKVLRKKEGDMLHVTNGKGLLVEGVISLASKKSAIFQVDRVLQKVAESDLPTIAISPTKNIDRFEWFLEKATEIGVSRIIPVICKNSERKVLKTDRLRKIIVGAMKQSGRLWLPQLEALQKIEDVFEKSMLSNRYIAHCHEGNKVDAQEIGNKENALILIGPEGGFSDAELKAAKESKCQELSLGDYRLRSETAGIVVCQLFN